MTTLKLKILHNQVDAIGEFVEEDVIDFALDASQCYGRDD